MNPRYLLKTLIEEYGVVVKSKKTGEEYQETMLNCNEALFLLQKDGLMMIADFREFYFFSDQFYLQPIESTEGYKVAMKYYIDRSKAKDFVENYFSKF